MILRCWTVPAIRSVEHLDDGDYAEPTTCPGLLFRNDIHGMEAMQSRAMQKPHTWQNSLLVFMHEKQHNGMNA